MEYVIIKGGVAADFTDGVQVFDLDNISTELCLDDLIDIRDELRSAPRDVCGYAADVDAIIEGHPDFCPRHAGFWGDDDTCEDCTDESGDPRPNPRHR